MWYYMGCCDSDWNIEDLRVFVHANKGSAKLSGNGRGLFCFLLIV